MKTNIKSVAKDLTLGRGGIISSNNNTYLRALKTSNGLPYKGYGLDLSGFMADNLYNNNFRSVALSTNSECSRFLTEDLEINTNLKFTYGSEELASKEFDSTDTAEIDVSSIAPIYFDTIDVDTTTQSISHSFKIDNWMDFCDTFNALEEKDQGYLRANFNEENQLLEISSTLTNMKFTKIVFYKGISADIYFNEDTEAFEISHKIEDVGIFIYEQGMNAHKDKTWVLYDSDLYICTQDHKTTESFDSSKWKPVPTVFEGATSTEAGRHGLVPKPQIEDRIKFLKGDGTWSQLTFNDVSGLENLSQNVLTKLENQEISSNKIWKSGYYAKMEEAPVEDNDLANKKYVDEKSGNSLLEAPADGKIYGRQNKDWTPLNYVTESDFNARMDSKQDAIGGAKGEVVYSNGSNTFCQQIMNTGMVVANEDELNSCKNNAPSFQTVFDTWTRFSHLNGVDNAKPSEVSAWTYNSSSDTIVQPLNTESYVGFVSPDTYSNYDITVRIYSNNSDDDSIGLVAAFATDTNGKQHTLSFIRNRGDANAGSIQWACILDLNHFNLSSTNYGQKILVDKTSTAGGKGGWNAAGTGTVINMTRNGNIFSAVCSQFGSSTLDQNTKITIDLDSLSNSNPILNYFKGSSPWGYSNLSQTNSSYENISVTDPNNLIFDLSSNTVLKYNNSTKEWDTLASTTPIDSVGAGRFSFNKITKKLYFCTGSEIFQVGSF